MKWIVLAIVLILVPYTIVTLRYRKEGPAFQPYQDLKSRANVARLLAAGYQRITLTTARPADGARAPGGAQITPAPGGVPEALASTLVEAPLLPVELLSVSAAPETQALLPYTIHFTCSLPSDQQQLGGAELYVRESSIVIIPTFERVGGNLQTRSRQAVVLLTIPSGALKPDHYTVTLVAERGSRTWPLTVK